MTRFIFLLSNLVPSQSCRFSVLLSYSYACYSLSESKFNNNNGWGQTHAPGHHKYCQSCLNNEIYGEAGHWRGYLSGTLFFKEVGASTFLHSKMVNFVCQNFKVFLPWLYLFLSTVRYVMYVNPIWDFGRRVCPPTSSLSDLWVLM